MRAFSQRRTFTTIMTFSATLFGTVYGVYEVRGQADFLTDIIKISGLLAIASVCVSYIFWTLTHLKKDNVFRGGLAGLLTGLTIVPVPYFTSTLKTEFFRFYNIENRGLLASVLEAIPLSLKGGLATFQLISKVSLVAVRSCVVLGIIIAKSASPLSEETPAALK